ncbi:MAG TPA: hypothetical protein VHW69_05780 [Rhizomicrobium sp.]|jgi:hypothetical protein|nr:hypothetical protein [Rhizomicrobium sp.]
MSSLRSEAKIGFASAQDQAIFAAAGKILYEDEHNLFGEAIAYFLPTGSITFVDREEDGQRNGPDRGRLRAVDRPALPSQHPMGKPARSPTNSEKLWR